MSIVKQVTLGENYKDFKLFHINESGMNSYISGVLEEIRDKCYDEIMKEGVGTAGGNTPSGGAPVWQGDPEKTTYYPGALRDAHNKESDGALHKAITVNNYMFYAPAVINGHSKAPPNRYHERALAATNHQGIIDKHLKELREKWLI